VPKKTFEVSKLDDDKRLVFGWASVLENEDGSPLEDLQGDVIAPDELESAVYKFVLDSRKAGEMHERTEGIGRLVESFVLTPEKAAVLGIEKRAGWWVGFKIDDDSTWSEVKKETSGCFQSAARRSELMSTLLNARIGAYRIQAMATELTELELDEVSLVDKGANQEAHVMIVKRGPLRRFADWVMGKNYGEDYGAPRPMSQIMMEDEAQSQLARLMMALHESLESIQGRRH